MKYLYKPQISDGRLIMSVIDPTAKSVVWNNTYPSFIEDQGNGDLLEDYTLIELGTMKGVNDVDGLAAYLKEIGILKDGDVLTLSFVEGLHQRMHQYSKGGKMSGFDKLASGIGKKLVGKPVPKKYRKQYGKTYDKQDAMEAGRNIAGSLVNEKKEDDKPEEKTEEKNAQMERIKSGQILVNEKLGYRVEYKGRGKFSVSSTVSKNKLVLDEKETIEWLEKAKKMEAEMPDPDADPEEIECDLNDIEKYPGLVREFLKLSEKDIAKKISGGCSTNRNYVNYSYTCDYSLLVLDFEEKPLYKVYSIKTPAKTYYEPDVKNQNEPSKLSKQEALDALYKRRAELKEKSVLSDRASWEAEISSKLADKLELSDSDAQAMMEANNFTITQCWGKGLTALETANKIIGEVSATENSDFESGYESLSTVFEAEYGISPMKLHEKALEFQKLPEYVEYEYAFAKAAHDLGISWNKEDRTVMAEMQVALLEEGIDFKEQIDGRHIDAGEEIRLPALEKPLPPKPTSALESFSTVVSTDDLRPAMMGVYYNAKRQEMAATDAHILAIRKEKVEGQSRIVNVGKTIVLKDSYDKETVIPHGGIIDARYPDYPVVIPEDNFLVYKSVPVISIYKQLNGVIKALKKFRKYSDEILISVDTPILSFMFSPILFKRLLDFFCKSGVGQVDIEFSIYNPSWNAQEDESNIGKRGVIIRASTSKDIYGLMMPVYTNDLSRNFFINLKGLGTPTIDKKYKDHFAKKPQVIEKVDKFLNSKQ